MDFISKICLTAVLLFTFSCQSESDETRDSVYWKQRYERLLKFVDKKGLAEEAKKAVQAPDVKHVFIIKDNTYIYNGSTFELSEIKDITKTIIPKNQHVNIITFEEVSHQRVLELMDALNRAGIENFNLITDRD